MAFRDNSTLVRSANTINLEADGGQATVHVGSNKADAFVIADGNVGDDSIIGFSSNDSIVTFKKIYDGNNDGYIAFGDNQTLDVDRTSSRNAGADNISVGGTGDDLVSIIRYLGTKDGQFAYADAGTRDSLFGHFDRGFTSTSGGGDASVAGMGLYIDNDVSSNTFAMGTKSVALLTDNALGLNFGSDTITGFGDDDLLVFTSALYDSDGSGIVTFGSNLVLDVSGANGPLKSDPRKGPGGQIDINSPDQTQVYLLGEKSIDGTTYYYYGTEGHGPLHTGI